MKPISHHTKKQPSLFLTLTSLLITATCSSAAVTISEIPPIAGLTSTRAYGINNHGVVCGKSFTTDNDDIAMLWSSSRGTTQLPSLSPGSETSAWGINDAGLISGFSKTAAGDKHGVQWDSDLAIIDIGTLINQKTGVSAKESESYGISSTGSITGLAGIPNDSGNATPFHAIVFDGSTLTDLGTLNTTSPEHQYGYSIAYNMNSAGKTIGIAHDNAWNFRPIIHDSATGISELAIDQNFSGGEWYATTINDSGMIGGHVIRSNGTTSPYFWQHRDSTPQQIPMLQAYPNGEIYSMNDRGQMVGIMWGEGDESTEHAFIFDTAFGVRDLNDFLPPNSGWVLSYARDINQNGQIVGSGKYNGAERGFLLSGLNLQTPGDFTNDGTIDLRDAIAVMQALTPATPTPINRFADTNNDGKAGIADAIFTLQHVISHPTSIAVPDSQLHTFQAR